MWMMVIAKTVLAFQGVLAIMGMNMNMHSFSMNKNLVYTN